MPSLTTRIAVRMTAASVRRPGVTVLIALGLVAFFLLQTRTLVKEVGYSAYFGRHNPLVNKLVDFQREFHVGLQLLVVFGCQDSPNCQRIGEPWTLDFIGRLHSAIAALPNVLKTTSVLNTPVVVGPLETRNLAAVNKDGSWQLAQDWRALLERGRSQGLMVGTVVSEDDHSAGLVVELESVDSVPMRDSVHSLFNLLAGFEDELGTEIYMAGEPIWNVVGADMIDHDSLVGTVGLFIVMFGILWVLFRDPWMTVLPLAAIGPLFAAIQGITGLLSIPVTLMLGIVPPLVLVIALTASLHFLTAFLRHCVDDVDRALVTAAEDVGSGCFWAAATTVSGFSAFTFSDLQGFSDVGRLAAIASTLGFVATFTLLPALICLRARRGRWRPAHRRTHIANELLAAISTSVARHSRLVLGASLVGLMVFASGMTQLYYAADVGFGDRSFVVRSFRFIEANLRKSETLDLSVQIPKGTRIYDESTLRLLADLEQMLERDPYTGRVWSFLDLLEEAYRIDHGSAAPSLDELILSTPRSMPIVASFEEKQAFWSETTTEDPTGGLRQVDRARISANRGFLGSEHLPYVARMRAAVNELQQRWGPLGYKIQLEGGVVLAELFLVGMRATQWQSFAAAFTIVVLVLVLLLRRGGFTLVFWSVAANVLPVVAVLGLIGWAEIGIDPVNAMLGAILLVIVVDDTIHMVLRYQRERADGLGVREALARCFSTVGEAILISSLCLSLGFCMMLTAQWGGARVLRAPRRRGRGPCPGRRSVAPPRRVDCDCRRCLGRWLAGRFQTLALYP